MIFAQTDTDHTALAGGYAGCSGVGPFSTEQLKAAAVGGTAGSVAETCSTNNTTGANLIGVVFALTIPAGTSGDAGTMTTRLNVTASNMNLTLNTVHVCRFNSGNAHQESLGSSTGLGVSLSTTGVKSVDVTLSATTFAAGDKVMVMYGISNGSMNGQSFQFTPDQNIDSPFTAVDNIHEPSVNDAVTVTESVTMMLNPIQFNVFDAVTVEDAPTVRMPLYPMVTDAVSVEDFVKLNMLLMPQVNDEVTVQEDVRVHPILMPNVSDSVTLEEAVTMFWTVLNINVNDAVIIAEDVTVSIVTPTNDLSVNVFDSVTVAEDSRVHILLMPIVSDDVTVVDQPAMNMLLMPNVQDSVTLEEAVKMNLLLMPNVFDAVSVAEDTTVTLVSAGVVAINVFDSVTVGDEVTIEVIGGSVRLRPIAPIVHARRRRRR